MKTIRMISTVLLIVFATILIMRPQPAWSQSKKQAPGTTPPQPRTYAKIEVKEFGGEFERWVNALTINSADKLRFRFSTDQPGASAGCQLRSAPVA